MKVHFKLNLINLRKESLSFLGQLCALHINRILDSSILYFKTEY